MPPAPLPPPRSAERAEGPALPGCVLWHCGFCQLLLPSLCLPFLGGNQLPTPHSLLKIPGTLEETTQ